MDSDLQDYVIFGMGLVLSAFFSGSEAALISIPAKRVKQLIEQGGAKARALQFLAEKPNEILTTILVGNNFVNIFVASLATTISQRHFASEALSYAVGATTLLILIFGEIIPKTFARNHAETLAMPVIRILQALYIIIFPMIWFFMRVIQAVLGKNAHLNERIVTKADIEFMVNEAEKENSIDSKQIDLLNSILEFPTIKVKDIMVPRSEVHWIKTGSPFDEILELVRDVAHSRYPVAREDLDETIGFLHVKDLSFVNIEDRKSFKIEDHLNDPFFVYEHMKIQAVFDHMNRKKVHLALVKDENGLVVGIVTLEDIMEEIFGEIQDEHDDDEDLINPESNANDTLEKGFHVNAGISLRDLYNEFDVKIPLNDNYSTLRGFLLHKLGNSFPKKGQFLYWNGISFELSVVENNEIEEVRLKSAKRLKTDSHEDVFASERREETHSSSESNSQNSKSNLATTISRGHS